jgi:amino acid adenylation domain-containing protein
LAERRIEKSMIVEKFEEQVKRFSQNTALHCGEIVWTYEALNQRVNRLAHLIGRMMGPPPAETAGQAALLFDHGAAMIVALLAVLKANMAYVPLDATYPENRLDYILDNAEIRLLVTNRRHLPLAQGLQARSRAGFKIVDIDSVDHNLSSQNPDRQASGDRLAYILYTSGSTGQPKGVMQTHGNVLYYIRNWTERFSISPADRLTWITAFTHDGAGQDIFAALLTGAALYPFDIKSMVSQRELCRWLMGEQLTIWHSVPTLFRYFVDSLSGGEDFSSLKYILLGGEPLRPRDIEVFRHHFPRAVLANVYGQTESSVDSIWFVDRADTLETVVIGQPLDRTEILLVAEDGTVVEELGVGEIVIACDHTAPGYWRDPGNTRRSFTLDPELGRLYWTGDLGGLLEDGNIEILGRKDSQIKLRGFRVEIGEIETVLLRHPGVREAVVTCVDGEGPDQYLCAYLVGHRPLASTELRDYLWQYLPDYMIPARFIQLETFPLTASGKIDRQALPLPEGGAEAEVYRPPQNETETALAGIWSDILAVEENRLGREANFFEWGGHSLKAINVIARVHKRFNVRLELEEIFLFPTLRALAQNIMEKEQEKFHPINRVEKREFYLLSSAQKRLFVLQQLEPDNIGYNLAGVVELEGKLDRERLQQTFHRLLGRHESLRTSLPLLKDEPVQRVHDHVDFQVEYYDLARETGRGEGCSPEDLIREFIRPFDLSRAPLLRAGVIKRGEDRHILMLDMHHVVTDGTSMQVFFREFMALYGGQAVPLPGVQYRDYSAWQQEAGRGPALNKQQAYWLTEFAADIPILNLPTDFPRPAVQSFAGSWVDTRIGREETGALRELALHHDATLYMVLLAAYNVLLARLSSQEDIVVGTPVAGRRHADLTGVIGMFVNTLALRNFPAAGRRFSDFLTEVRARTLSAFENQDYQFEDLVEQVAVTRDVSRNPLFDTMFMLLNIDTGTAGLPEIVIPELRLKSHEYRRKSVIFDLELSCLEAGESLRFRFRYCTGIFTAESIQRFAGYFRTILSAVVEGPGRRLGEIDILLAAEKERILETFNDTRTPQAVPPGLTLHGLVAQQAARTPDHMAVVVGSPPSAACHLSCQKLDEEAHRYACLLTLKGVAADTVVPVILEQSPDTIIAILGIMKAGGAYLPIDPAAPAKRRDLLLADSGAPFVLTDQSLTEMGRSGHAPALPPQQSPLSLAYVIYTSGSTGRPRGVMVGHGAIVNMLLWRRQRYRMGSGDVVLQMASFSFDSSVEEIFTPLISGARMVVVPRHSRLDLPDLAAIIRRCQVTHLAAVPGLYRSLVQEIPESLTGLKAVTLGGEQLDRDLVGHHFHRLAGVKLYNEYGPTENSVCTTLYEVPPHADRVYIGRPITNVACYILDRCGQPSPLGTAGELCLSGAGLARGYLNNPEFTAERFVNAAAKAHQDTRSSPHHPLTPKSQPLYRTGDLCRWLPDGNIEFLGRIDFQVKIRGYRIELGEIETQLLRHENIKQAVVTAQQDRGGDRCLTAYIVPAPATNRTNRTSRTSETSLTNQTSQAKLRQAKLRQYLAEFLPVYMIPTHFVFLAEMPLTATGKVDRQALPEPRSATAEEYEAPVNDIEKKLLEIWSELPGMKQGNIGVAADFFGLGGNSLRATVMTARIHRVFGVKVPLAEVFRTPYIRGMARYIQQAGQERYAAIKQVEERAFYELSSAQERLYVLHQLDPGSTAYNIPFVVRLQGEVEQPQLQAAFQALIRRHEALRTSFHLVDGEPVQRILRRSDVEIEVYRSTEVDGLIRDFIRPFDLSRPPLVRVGLIRLAQSACILMVDVHHIAADGVSMGLLMGEFMAAYGGGPLPGLPYRYRDYALWQRRRQASAALAGQQGYWLREFAGEIPLLNLPLDFPRARVQRFIGSRLPFEIAEADTRALDELAARAKASLFMTVLALLNLLLSKLGGQQDIIVGAPVAGREREEMRAVVGMFVNTLALRNFPAGEKRFGDFLAEVAERTLQAFDNQEYQFEDLVEQLAVGRDSGRNPLFDVMLVLQDLDPPTLGIPALRMEPYRGEVASRAAKFDLTLQGMNAGDRLVFSLEYNSQLFNPETGRRVVSYFKKIVSEVVRAPAGRLDDIEIITPQERRQILVEFNRTAAPFPGRQTIPALFAQQAARTADHTAVVGPAAIFPRHDLNLTYGELHRRAGGLANGLMSRGIGPGHVVGLMVGRRVEMVIAMLAVLKGGGAYLPIDTDCPADRVGYMMADSGARILLTDADSEAGLWAADPPPPEVADDGGMLAYVIYTSGTTGRPRGVLVEHRSLVNVVTWFARRYRLQPGDRVLQLTRYTFDASANQIFGSLLAGAGLYIVSTELMASLERLRAYMEKNRISLVNFVPAFLQEIFGAEGRIESIKAVIAGGEQLKESVKEQLLEKGYDLHNQYGPTETTIDALAEKCSARRVTLGKPIANVRCYVLSPAGHHCPPGVVGELHIAGAGLARGYLNNPELTAEKFINVAANHQPLNPKSQILYRTGDLARWLPEGNIEFLGRRDHQVKIRGYRLELGEIERQLLNHEGVKEALVLARQDPQAEVYLTAYIVPHPSDSGGAAAWRQYLCRFLPDYMIPAYFVRLDRLPRTPFAKIDVRALPEPQPADSAAPAAAPAGEQERQLLAICRDILNRPDLSLADDFFASGGNSLKTIKLIARLGETFGVEIPLGQIFKTPVIQDISSCLRQARFLHSQEETVVRLNQPHRPGIFCFPPAIGFGMAYMQLADQLADYSLYAFNYIDDEDKMERYVDTIAAVQPQGPYILLGYSAGGKLALKAAGILEERGYEVKAVIMLDCYRARNRGDEAEAEALSRQFIDQLNQGLEQSGLAHLGPRVMDKLAKYKQYHDQLQDLTTIRGNIYLIQAADKRGQAGLVGWQEYCGGEYQLVEGYGSHPRMLQSGYVRQNAALIREIIQGHDSREIEAVHRRLSVCSLEFLKFMKTHTLTAVGARPEIDGIGEYPAHLNPWPTFVSRSFRQEMAQVAGAAFKLLKTLPRRIFNLNANEMAAYYHIPVNLAGTQVRGYNEDFADQLIARGDFVLTADGFRCLEMNISANLGGLHLPFFKSFYLQNPLISEFLKDHGITIVDQNLLSVFLRHAIQAAQGFLGASVAEFNLAIAFPEYGSQADVDSLQAALDELFHRQLIETAGGVTGKVVCCDLNQLRVEGDVLYYRRQEINILMEMYGGVVPPEMIQLFQERRLCLFNGPISGLLSNKLNLALLSEQADSRLFSQEERQAIRRYIPWTRKIVSGNTSYSGQTIDLPGFIRGQQQRLVIKPAARYGGQGVTVGRHTPPKAWQEVLERALREQNWLVQEYCESLPLLYPAGQDQAKVLPHDAVWGTFIFGSLYGGSSVRVLPKDSSGGVINVQQGATASVVFEVDE